MSMLPCLMHMKIQDDNHHVNLWIPLFLVWLILAALAIALAPLVLILALVLWQTGWGKFLLLLGPALYSCLSTLNGLRVDVDKDGKQLFFSFR